MHIASFKLLTVGHPFTGLQFIMNDAAFSAEPLFVVVVCKSNDTTECRMIATYCDQSHADTTT